MRTFNKHSVPLADIELNWDTLHDLVNTVQELQKTVSEQNEQIAKLTYNYNVSNEILSESRLYVKQLRDKIDDLEALNEEYKNNKIFDKMSTDSIIADIKRERDIYWARLTAEQKKELINNIEI